MFHTQFFLQSLYALFTTPSAHYRPIIEQRPQPNTLFDPVTYWKYSWHMALSPPFRFRHLMLLEAASWQGSSHSLLLLLWTRC